MIAEVRMVSLLLTVATLLGWPAAVRAQLPGTVDPAFAPVARPDGNVAAIATQSDGKLILGGNFYRVGSVVAPAVARLNADGSVDASFAPPANLGQIVALTVGPDGKTVFVQKVGDNYPETYNLIRLNPDGSRDASFAQANFTGTPNTGDIHDFSVAVQADGKVLVEGEFYRALSIGPSIERFNANGSLDTTFQFSKHIEATNLSALLPLPNGQILVGGNSVEYGGQTAPARFLFRLNADGSVDDTYNPDTADAGTVYALALQPDGKVVYLGYVAPSDQQGGFVTLGGVPRRLNAEGTADTGFVPKLAKGASFTSLLIQPDGKVLAGGYTANSGSVIPSGIVRINADGTLDTTFKPAVPLVSANVNALGLLPDGQIIVGGDFDTIASLSRIGLARLNANGTADTSYTNDLTIVGVAYAVAIQANGLPLLLDSFYFSPPDAVASQRAGRRPATVLASGPFPGPLASFNLDGSLNTVFSFGKPSGEPGYQLVVFPTLYTATATQPANSVLARQADGKILVTGYFADGEPYLTFDQIERFNVDGSLDADFIYRTATSNDGATYAVLPQPDGKILRAGVRGAYEGNTYPLNRLNADSSYDAAFSPAIDPGSGDDDLSSTFYALALQPDGKVIAGGALRAVNGQPVADVLRFNANGSVDSSFKAGVLTETSAGKTPYAFSLALQADGKVIVGGNFSTIGGVPRNNLARLNKDGSLDAGFDAHGLGANGLVRAILVQTDGKIVIGGEFTTTSGTASNGIARLNADGTTDPLFFPGGGTAGTGHVNSLAFTPDGGILVGGTFKKFGGQPRDGVALIAGGTLTTPAITSAPVATVQVGQALAYQITASESPVSFGVLGLPSFLTVNASGLLSGTPPAAGTYTMQLTATNPAGTGKQDFTLTVAPEAPTVTVVTAGDGMAMEGGEKGKFLVERTGDTSAPLIVFYKVKGSAKQGVDIKPLAGNVTIPAGSSKVKVKVKPIDNATHDGTRKCKLRLLPASDGSYLLGDPAIAKVKVIDND